MDGIGVGNSLLYCSIALPRTGWNEISRQSMLRKRLLGVELDREAFARSKPALVRVVVTCERQALVIRHHVLQV